MRENFMAVPGGKVWYGIAGEEATGIPLLTLHGGPGASHDYLELLAELADERPVIFYDQRGGGRSEASADPAYWTLDYFVDELAALVDFLGLKRFHLLGQSWGTTLAVEYWLRRRPAQVVSLTLSAPCLDAPRWGADQRAALTQMAPEHRQAIMEAEASGVFDSPGYQAAMDELYHRHVCRLDPWPESFMRTINGMNQQIYSHMWGASEFTVSGTLKDYTAVPRLGELALPVLLTCGEFDEATPSSTAFFAQAIPGAQMTVFEDASHLHHLEKPTEFLVRLRRFLAEEG